MITKQQAAYIRWGQSVATPSGEQFKLISDTDKDTLTAKAVRLDQSWRYERLTAWVRNKVLMTDDERKELEEMPVILNISECTSLEKIRIRGAGYRDLFEVENFGTILVNGSEHQVVYIDSSHFYFVSTAKDGAKWYDPLHIDEFADMCERCHAIVEKV